MNEQRDQDDDRDRKAEKQEEQRSHGGLGWFDGVGRSRVAAAAAEGGHQAGDESAHEQRYEQP